MCTWRLLGRAPGWVNRKGVTHSTEGMAQPDWPWRWSPSFPCPRASSVSSVPPQGCFLLAGKEESPRLHEPRAGTWKRAVNLNYKTVQPWSKYTRITTTNICTMYIFPNRPGCKCVAHKNIPSPPQISEIEAFLVSPFPEGNTEAMGTCWEAHKSVSGSSGICPRRALPQTTPRVRAALPHWWLQFRAARVSSWSQQEPQGKEGAIPSSLGSGTLLSPWHPCPWVRLPSVPPSHWFPGLGPRCFLGWKDREWHSACPACPVPA